MAGTINENDMYTLLSQVFKPEVANTLLQQLKGETKPAPIVDRVMPGDLITAELMNRIIAELADLQRRVSFMELPATNTDKGVVILEPDPNAVLRIGDKLTIRGLNLLENSVVKINETPLVGLIGSADNKTLMVNSIPPIDSVVGSGSLVTLLVTNTAGTDTAPFTLKPRELTKPIGNLLVTQTGGPIPAPANNKYKAGNRYLFIFTITADTRPDETFTLKAAIDNDWTIEIIDPVTEIPLSPSEILIEAAKNATTPSVKKVYVAVEIPDTAQNGDVGNLTLHVQSKRNHSIEKLSEPKVAITVEGDVQAPKNMALALLNTAGDAGIRDNGDGTKTALVLADSGNGGELEFEVKVPTSGNYIVDVKMLGDQTPAKWSLEVSGTVGTVLKLSAPKDSIFILAKAKLDAPKATIAINISSESNTSDLGYLEQAVETLLI